MHVVRHQMPFQNLRLALLRKPPENLAQMRALVRIDRLPPALRNKHDMIIAVPGRVV